MHQAASWRELLGNCIANPQERQRIASALGVRPITLMRWANGESLPRPQNLRQLVTVLPSQQREALVTLLEIEVPGFSAAFQDEAGELESATIPGEFYMRVLQTRASVPASLRYSVLSDLILQQALKHLDPQRLGVGISIARCLPLSNGDLVRGLLTDMGRGSTPWEQNMEHETMLLGAESLAGYAVTSGHRVAIANLHASNNLFPASLGVWEKSAAAAPITFEGRIAGSLLVSSTQADYFSPVRQQFVSSYADLVALTLGEEQFYDPQRIQLGVFPSQQEQRVYIAGFQQRLLETIRQAAERKEFISVVQAEQLVWQQIEEDLLQRPLTETDH